jgi:hypothetical protein
MKHIRRIPYNLLGHYQDEDELRLMKGGKMKKSNLILDTDDEDDNVGKAANVKMEGKRFAKKKEFGEATTSFSDLIQGQSGDLLFIQLPDHLPGTVPDVKAQSGSNSASFSKPHCNLDLLPEGYLGMYK